MSIGFEFVAQPNGGSLSYDQFFALHTLINKEGGANWSVRDPNNGKGELEVSNWDGRRYIMDAVGMVTLVKRWEDDRAPAALAAGVNWWLNDPGHSEDVVALTDDGQDALILSGLNSPDKVAWVNPDGTVQVMEGRWLTVHHEEEES